MVKRAGFGLVEVIIAMTLIGVGVLSIAASAAFATSMLRRSENREGAARIAGMLIDSLAFSTASSAGTRDIGRFRAEWSVGSNGDAEVRITIRGEPNGEATVVRADLLPLLPLVPCDSAACND